MRRPALLLLVLGGLVSALGCNPVVIEELDEAVLAVRSTSPSDVWAFGADAGAGPLALHWDGSAWERIDTSSLTGMDLWWGHPTEDQVFLAGSEGLVAILDRPSGAITAAEGIDPAHTFFGVWGPSSTDIWAVGGAIGAGLPPAAQRWDGTAWTPWEDPAGPGEEGDVYFKVHGTSASDVWIVGNRGIASRWDGTTLTDTDAASVIADDAGNAPSLLTIDVGGDAPVAVGGAGVGEIIRWNGSAWMRESPDFAPGMLGVCSGPDGALRAVGGQGSVYDFDGSTWEQWERGITFKGLHGCLIDADGGFWTGGGSIAAAPLDDGILIYDGPAAVKQP